jgi:quinone-modifying oxidoreductase subunit QmoC
MAGEILIKPDLDFVKRIVAAGGDTAKKCYQCDTCSVVCNISPDTKPFPRKEMIQAQWGLKDVLKSPDIWLCHQCSDCTVLCPRGAKPGEVLGVLRQMAIEHYAFPAILARMVGDIRFLPLLVLFPMVILVFVLKFLGVLGLKVAEGLTHQGLAIPQGKIIYAKWFPTLAIDAIFMGAAGFAAFVFFQGVRRYWNDINVNPWTVKLKGGVLKNLVAVVTDILAHNRFKKCETTFARSLNHLMVVFGFIFLAVVTGTAFLLEWVFHIDSPYNLFSNLWWLKVIALIGTGLLLYGIYQVYLARKANAEQAGPGTYFDWQLIYLVAAVGLTGALSYGLRALLPIPVLAYPMYFLHLTAVFCLFFFAPFTKLAHLVYRTVAMLYARMSDRGF